MITEKTRHLTASMVVLDRRGTQVLLVDHKASGQWLFPGGHVDEDESPAEAARREVLEETGVRAYHSGQAVMLPGAKPHHAPFTVQEFSAPEKLHKGEPAHSHVDELFLGWADADTPLVLATGEVADARWVPLEAVRFLNTRPDVPAVLAVIFGDQD